MSSNKHKTPASSRNTNSSTRKPKLITEQTKQISIDPQHPASGDRGAWRTYWEKQGQPWRTEPEIDIERQKYLDERRAITPNIEQGIYPFKGIKLSRADVEWLLVTHENGLGPVDWSDESQRERVGLDLRGANLRSTYLGEVDLSGLPLTRLQGGLELSEENEWTDEQRNMAAVILVGANLEGSHLEGSDLEMAHLEVANLKNANLEGANLVGATLKLAFLFSANLDDSILVEANLKGALLSGAHMERADLLLAKMEGANLSGTQMEGATLIEAHLENTNFVLAHLEGVWLSGAHLEGADFSMTYMEEADLSRADLRGAELRGARLEGVDLGNVTLASQDGIGPQLADVQWGSTNLAVAKWSQVKLLGDEHEAHQKNGDNGKRKDKAARLTEYEEAVRANRQLAVALQAQGLNEEVARFAYRAQVLQQRVLWFQMFMPGVRLRHRVQALGSLIFSWFLFLLAGYGYRPGRSVLWYLAIIIGFAAAYSIFGHLPLLPDAFVFSLTSFHGRGFFPGLGNQASLHNPLVVLASAQAVIGLFIEISFIATFTQRFFGK